MLLMTLYWSLPAMVNVGSVLMLFLIIYSIIGMNLFAEIKYGEEINDHANFE
jgi:hypothetical protein